MNAVVRKKQIAAKDRVPAFAAFVGPTMLDAKEQGFLDTNESRITARVSAKMIAAAKARTGIVSDSELVKFALARMAIEDPFQKAFRELQGSIDPDIDLEF